MLIYLLRAVVKLNKISTVPIPIASAGRKTVFYRRKGELMPTCLYIFG